MNRKTRRRLIALLSLLLVLHLLPLWLVRAATPDFYDHHVIPTFVNGQRVTVGQPTTYRYRVLLFGNSALRGKGVSDGETIASQIQMLFPDVRIENYGTDGAGIALELLTAQQVARRGDVVIFYDTVGVAYPYFPLCRLPLGIVAAPCQWYGLQYADEQAERDALTTASQMLAKARQDMPTMGATFVHVWMPLLYSASLSPDEQALSDASRRWSRIYLGYESVPPTPGYLEKMQAVDPSAVRFVHLLDAPRRESGGWYFDSLHTTAKANRLIAAALVPIIRQAVTSRCTAVI